MNSEGKHAHFERPTAIRQQFPLVRRMLYLVGVIIIAILSGALGVTLINRYLPSYELQLYQPYASTPPLVLSGHPIPYALLHQRVGSGMGSIFRKEQRATRVPYDRLPNPELYIAPAIMLTSDGWMFTLSSLLQHSDQYELYVQGSFFSITEVIPDKYTGVTFIRVNMQNAIPVDLSDAFPQTGEQLFFWGEGPFVDAPFTVMYVGRAPFHPIATKLDYIQVSSERSITVELIPVFEDSSNEPLVMFNDTGQVAGVAVKENNYRLLIPAMYLKFSFEQLVQGQAPLDLGIYYIDYSDALLSPNSKGILIYHPTKKAIMSGSLAEKSGLRVNDTIIAINGDAISQHQPFDYLWMKHQRSSEITFMILRNDEEVRVTLAPRK